MRFWKMHGCGNDFIAIDGRHDNRHDCDYGELAKTLCNRKVGIGADGLLIVKDSELSDIKMVYYNADGSRGAMCGNGIRCFSKYVHELSIVRKKEFSVETLDGQKYIQLYISDKEVSDIKVSMGEAVFDPCYIPVHKVFAKNNRFIEEDINLLDNSFIRVSSVLVGVPHTVVFTEKDLSVEDVCRLGKEIENHSAFPERTNVNFVTILDKCSIRVKTWERGCGYTLACGTGMTASAIISNYLGFCGRKVDVSSEGGRVQIEITNSTNFMTGPAIKVFEGELTEL